MWRWLKRIGSGALALLLLTVAALLLWRAAAQERVARNVALSVPPGIDRLELVSLGGLRQWISLRGRNAGRPVLLFLHGGPGFPQMPFMENNALLERDFVVVQWDQRGAGKSFDPSIPPATINIAQLTSDAHELVELLRRRFGGQQIYLCAHSFGTIIGALLVSEHPEDFRAYIGISQIGDMMMTERVLYNFSLRYAHEHGRHEAETEFRKLGPPPHEKKAALETVIKWSHEFGGEIHPQTRPQDLLLRAFASPQYSLCDDLDILRGAAFSSQNLWRESYHTSLFQRAPRIDVPAFFLAGRHDYAVTATIAHRYFEALQAPRGKEFIWFENSSHFPDFEEPRKFQQVMKSILQRTGG